MRRRFWHSRHEKTRFFGCGICSSGVPRPSLPSYVTGTWARDGATDAGGYGLRDTRSNSQIPTSIPSEFPRIDISRRALGQDEIDAAIQTTSTSKVRRVDFGGFGPVI